MPKSRNLLIRIALLMMTVTAPAVCSNADDFIPTIEKIKASIAPVVCLSGDAQRPTISYDGSAFFIDTVGTFLTAAHVISVFSKGQPLGECPVAAIYVPQEDHWHAQPQQIRWHKFIPSSCALSTIDDLAECRTIDDISRDPSSLFHPVPIVFEDEHQHDGTPVAFSGFPLNNPSPLSALGFVAGYINDDNGLPNVVIDRTNWPGASGSPVYLSNGRVIGMVLRRGTGEASGISIARSVSVIRQFMIDNPLPQ